MSNQRIENIEVENARMIRRNFEGREEQYNRAGIRYFLLLINEEDVEPLLAEGWNIKRFPPRDGEEIGNAFLKVSVSFDNIPPNIYMITRKNKIKLDKDTVSRLDYAEIECADLVIRPYSWAVQGKSGVKAYLKEAYIRIVEDRFAEKYSQLETPEDDLPF